MILNHQVSIILSTFFSIFVIWYGFFFVYRECIVDRFREKMFSLRDEFFDEAMKENINFNDYAYGLLRNTMNGFIRYAHRVSFFDCLVKNIFLNSKSKTCHEFCFSKKWKKATTSIDKRKAEIFNKYREKMQVLVFFHILLNSPILSILLVVPFLIFSVPFNILKKIKIRVKKSFRNNICLPLESSALAYGKEALTV